MLPLDERVEHDSLTFGVKAHPELDVLDRRQSEASLVEPAGVEERHTPDGAETRPKGRGRSRTFLVHVVMEQVAKGGNDATRAGIVVVGAEKRDQAGLAVERVSNASESVFMHLDIGVEEDEHVAAGSTRTEIPRGRRTDSRRGIDNDHLVWPVLGALDRIDNHVERRGPVSRGNDHAEARHLLTVDACEAPSSRPGLAYAESVDGNPANDAPYRLIDDVHFGDSVIVSPFTNLYGCRVGDETRIGPFVEVQRGVIIGARCKIQSHAFICTGVTIGDDVFIGHGAIFINDKFPRATGESGALKTPGEWELLETVVESGVAVGSGAIVGGGLQIGSGALIGAGAVVTRDIAPGETVVGVPARARQSRP
jgi:acetyltransferase-like isoleucine patch superfamily enzyme